MENGKRPAFQTSIGMGNSEMKEMGLTKREYFAGLAMQGILSDGAIVNSKSDIAEQAVKLADALLEALSKP